MKAMIATSLLLCLSPAVLYAQTTVPNPLHRQYHEGETLVYRMTGINESWHYSIQANNVVKKDANGAFFEEVQWSAMVSGSQPVALSASSTAMRQQFSLDPNFTPAPLNLRQIDPRMIGPVTDFATFYVDLWLALKTRQLTKPGNHFYFNMPMPSSWADGNRTVLGEDSIAFDMTWKSTNAADQTATLAIRHVPPEKPKIHLIADWMQKPVADTPNNWVQVQKSTDGKFEAAVGKETFDVELKVSLKDGKILHGSMKNPVMTIERTCTDQALTQCDAPRPHEIMRMIEISLVQ
jgi:hypothetical protein